MRGSQWFVACKFNWECFYFGTRFSFFVGSVAERNGHFPLLIFSSNQASKSELLLFSRCFLIWGGFFCYFYIGHPSTLNWFCIHSNLQRESWRSCDEVGILQVAFNSRSNIQSVHGSWKGCGWCSRDSSNSHAFCMAIWRKECVSLRFFHTVDILFIVAWAF